MKSLNTMTLKDQMPPYYFKDIDVGSPKHGVAGDQGMNKTDEITMVALNSQRLAAVHTQ